VFSAIYLACLNIPGISAGRRVCSLRDKQHFPARRCPKSNGDEDRNKPYNIMHLWVVGDNSNNGGKVKTAQVDAIYPLLLFFRFIFTFCQQLQEIAVHQLSFTET
jgi:hypothetical protein